MRGDQLAEGRAVGPDPVDEDDASVPQPESFDLNLRHSAILRGMNSPRRFRTYWTPGFEIRLRGFV